MNDARRKGKEYWPTMTSQFLTAFVTSYADLISE